MSLHARSPRTTFRVARATAWVLIPSAVALLISMGAGLVPEDNRVVFALYNALLVGGLGAATVAALASCQIAIHHAFRAGFDTGQASVWPGDQETRPRRGGAAKDDGDPLLKLVE